MSEEARRHHRVPFVGPVRLSWEDKNAGARFAQGRCIDVSENGMRIECHVPIAAGTRLQVNAERINFTGAATVKHTSRYGGKYIIGVELAQAAKEAQKRI